MIVKQVTKQDWALLSENAHKIAFSKYKPAAGERIDYALLCENGDGLSGYVTVRELDSESVYWQFGGAFPGTKGTVASWRTYNAMIAYCKDKYKRITTLIENDNSPMLKMAAKVGFKIIGIRNFNGIVLLEHGLEFEKGGT